MFRQPSHKNTQVLRLLNTSVFILVSASLSSCGGGDEDGTTAGKQSGEKQIQAARSSWFGRVPPSISGKVIDGYISGAKVFWDCNGNWRADGNEVATTSVRGGNYKIGIAPQTTCILRAEVGVGAIDEDTNAPNIRTFVMSALPGKPILITPITTLVAMGAGTEESVSTALGIPSDLTRDYLSAFAADTRSHNAARTAAVQLQAVSVDTLAIGPAAATTAYNIVTNTQYVLANTNQSAPISSTQLLSWLANGPVNYFSGPLPSTPLGGDTAVSGKHALSTTQTTLLQEILRSAVAKGFIHGNEIVFSRFSDSELSGLNPRLEAAFGNNSSVVSILKERQAEIEVENAKFKAALAGENKFLDTKTTIAIMANASRSLYGISEFVTAVAPSPVGLTAYFSAGVTATGKIRLLKTRAEHLRRYSSRIPQCSAAAMEVAGLVHEYLDKKLTDKDLFAFGNSTLSLAGCFASFIREDPKLDRVFAEAAFASVSKSVVLGEVLAWAEAVKAIADVGLSFFPQTLKFQMALDGALDYLLGICQSVKAVEELNEALANKISLKAEELAALQKPILDNILKSFKIRILAERVNPYLSAADSACLPGAVVVDLICVAKPEAGFGNRYELIDCGTWSQCREAAIAKGGQLATIRSQAENDWLMATFASKVKSSVGFWIGYTDSSNEGVWGWASGEPKGFENWGASPGFRPEPNNSDGVEHYAHAYVIPGINYGKWNDAIDDTRGVITEAVVEYRPAATTVQWKQTTNLNAPWRSDGVVLNGWWTYSNTDYASYFDGNFRTQTVRVKLAAPQRIGDLSVEFRVKNTGGGCDFHLLVGNEAPIATDSTNMQVFYGYYSCMLPGQILEQKVDLALPAGTGPGSNGCPHSGATHCNQDVMVNYVFFHFTDAKDIDYLRVSAKGALVFKLDF